jgi:hypothetical protein
MTTQILTQNRLKKLLDYNPDTGIFNRRMANGRLKILKSLNQDGYIRFQLDKKFYFAHTLAWLYMTGKMPTLEIDHKNRIKTDNTFNNLREATRSEQCQNKDLPINSTSGFKGVSWKKAQNRWFAHIKLKGKKYHLGYYNDINDAIVARKQAELIYHPHRAI